MFAKREGGTFLSRVNTSPSQWESVAFVSVSAPALTARLPWLRGALELGFKGYPNPYQPKRRAPPPRTLTLTTFRNGSCGTGFYLYNLLFMCCFPASDSLGVDRDKVTVFVCSCVTSCVLSYVCEQRAFT